MQVTKIAVSLQSYSTNAEIAQLVEHDLAKVGVASSSLVFRSLKGDTTKCHPFSILPHIDYQVLTHFNSAKITELNHVTY